MTGQKMVIINYEGHDGYYIGYHDTLLDNVKEFMAGELYEMSLNNTIEQSGQDNQVVPQCVDTDNDVDPEYKMFLVNHGCVVNGNDADPDYKMFLDNLREDGDSYVFERNVGQQVLPVRIKYEADDELYTRHGLRAVKTKKNRVMRSHSKAKRGLKNALRRETKTQGLLTSRNVPRVKTRYTQRCTTDVVDGENNISVVKKNVKQTSEPNNKQSSPEVLDSFPYRRETEKYRDMVDESYLVYLASLQSGGDYLGNTPENSTPRCEKDKGNFADMDVLVIDDHPFSDEEVTPFVPSKSYFVLGEDETGLGMGKPGGSVYSWFRVKLMDILRRPYDEAEYNDLFQKASVRKPLTRVRQLRDGREMSYETDIPAKSYLDRYSDLKRTIKLCGKDRHKILKLLRGFFCYLQNLSHEEAFIPWEDEECMKITMKL